MKGQMAVIGMPRGIHENLHFLITEVRSQISSLGTYFDTYSITMAKRILDSSGYIYNLKTNVQTGCLDVITQEKKTFHDIRVMRSFEAIATDLNHIAELCRDCVRQTDYLDNVNHLPSDWYISLLGHVSNGISMIETAINKNDSSLALKIGRVEKKLDHAYRKLLKKHIGDFKRRKRNCDGHVISILFIAHFIEQMGDMLLSISNTIISSNLGQPFNTGRYHSLHTSIAQLSSTNIGSGLALEAMSQTRSGNNVLGLCTTGDKDNACLAIFKDGQKHKLREERKGMNRWQNIYPGLVPKILSYHKRGKSAALLIEHLSGLTFEQILLHEPSRLLKQSMRQLQNTMESIWNETRTEKPVFADYMGQLEKRLGDIYALHPELNCGNHQICDIQVEPFDMLLQQVRSCEAEFKAPFSVYIHGDFNVDNIIYDPLEKKINFIDVHRSKYMDYVQDVSVLMVSHYRLHVINTKLRRRILDQSCIIYDFAADYADKMSDQSFNIRLALSLARSFATSTRFILDKTLVRAMWLRARYLMNRVLIADREQPRNFQVPVRELFIA